MSNQWAKVVLDSVAPNGRRLITVEARYARWIHCELLTHRAFARNAASSRAIPFVSRNDNGSFKDTCTFAMLSGDPFIPDFIGAKQKGMQSGEELTGDCREDAEAIIHSMRLFCLDRCLQLDRLGVHKSIINRYLEPWSYITTLITATEWKNFFRLRIHPAAEKHFNDIATKIKAAIDGSTPTPLLTGEWHLPYIQDSEREHGHIKYLRMASSARCSRISYLNHSKETPVFSDDIKSAERLLNPGPGDDEPPHISPFEHVAMAMGKTDAEYRSGPFFGWHQFRKEFANENLPG